MKWNSKRTGDRRGSEALRRRLTPERLEARQLLAADPIHVGVVYLETDYLESDQDAGGDSRGDRFILSFVGGAPNTELTEVRINTDKDGDGISVGDPIYDTAPGGRGTAGSAGFQVVRVRTSDGRAIDAVAEVEDGGQELVLRLSNFRAGDRLEFTLDVDEVLRNAIDLAVFNDRLDVITSGQEFQDSILGATFEAPHYETSFADSIFINHYGDPNQAQGLNVPPDAGDDIDSRPDRSAAAIATTNQVPLPISISGHVWVDNDLDLSRELNEQILRGIELALWQRDAATRQYVDTGHRSRTDSFGRYEFPQTLALLPGEYRVVETQPAGMFSVGAVPGTIEGNPVGLVETADILTNIVMPLGGQASINNDFAEAQAASLRGYVYRDNNNDGIRDDGEQGIAGVTVRLLPINTIAPQAELTVTTESNGSYTFRGLAPGEYEVLEVNQPAGLDDGLDTAGTVNGAIVGVAQNPGDHITAIMLHGREDGIEYNFGELPYGSIAGSVFLAAPGADCTGDHDAPGTTSLPGVAVQLQRTDGFVVSQVTTRSDGSYQFNDVPRGIYRIVQFTPTDLLDGNAHPGTINGVQVGTAVGGGLIQDITMTAAGVGIEYNFCEIAPATISGYVYHDQSDDGIRDQSEDGIAKTTVTLVDASGQVVATTTTDTSGRYEFTGIEPGEYSLIETQPPGFFDGIDTPGQIAGQRVGVPGSDGDSLRSIPIKQGQEGSEFNFGELLGATLRGMVHADTDGDCEIDPGEQPLAGVTIRLLDAQGNEVARTSTAADGRYKFENIAPGQYTVIEEQPNSFFEGDSRPGTAGGVSQGPSRIGQIDLASGEIAVDYNFCEHPPAEIIGSVFSDANGDCLFDPDEIGIAGVLVELFDQSNNLIASTTTDAMGNYRFSNLPAGSYTIRETQPEGWIQGSQRAGSGGGDDSVADVISRIPVRWGERLTQYNFCELAPSSIAGIVHVDTNGDCLNDPGETTIAGVAIELRDRNGTLVAQTVTDAGGRYQFAGLVPGEYQIIEHQPAGYFHGGQRAGEGGVVLGDDHLGLTLLAGSDVVDFNFCELEPASLSGSVWQEADLNRRYDPGDTPIPGVLIELIDDAGDVVEQTTTDSQGNYQFETLIPGVYGVRERQPNDLFHGGQIVGSAGGDVAEDDFIVGITLGSGTRATGYNFPEVPPASLSGFVFQDGDALKVGQPPAPEDLRRYRDGQLTGDDQRLPGVMIELRNVFGQPFLGQDAMPGVYPDGPIRTLTDANGFYQFVGLRPGSYHVYEVQPEHYVDGLDSAGTTGGLAVNPADVIDADGAIMIQTLAASDATDPRNDAILNIQLVGNTTSEFNNFSEIIIEPLLVILADVQEEVPKVTAPIETFDARIKVATFAAFEGPRKPVVAIDEWAVSWHLSLINGGFPRGVGGTDARVLAASAKELNLDWTEQDFTRGRWTLMNQAGQPMEISDQMTMGIEDATALAGDFDGDGADEVVLYIGGQWFVDLNGNGRWDEGDLWILMGTEMDRPVVGDWDGDGKDDIAIFGRQWHRDPHKIKLDPGLPDPANKRRRHVDTMVAHREDRGDDQKRLLRRGDQGELRADIVDHVFQYGEQVDTPLSGDWNGDGIDQIGVFRSGLWMLDADGDGRWTQADDKATFGKPGDEPVVGDFNGDGIDDIAVVRGNTWIIDSDGDRRITGNDKQIEVPRTNDDSQPVVGDWDGDGKDDPGYYDEAA